MHGQPPYLSLICFPALISNRRRGRFSWVLIVLFFFSKLKAKLAKRLWLCLGNMLIMRWAVKKFWKRLGSDGISLRLQRGTLKNDKNIIRVTTCFANVKIFSLTTCPERNVRATQVGFVCATLPFSTPLFFFLFLLLSSLYSSAAWQTSCDYSALLKNTKKNTKKTKKKTTTGQHSVDNSIEGHTGYDLWCTHTR